MASERVRRQIDRLLDEAEQAVALRDWAVVRTAAQDALDLDPENGDAAVLLGAAQRALARAENAAASSAAAGDPEGAISGRSARSAVSPEAQNVPPEPVEGKAAPSAHPEPVEGPTSFANGRYAVKRFLGEGGKKRVYLAHDTLLDRDVAFALIKAEGLDEEARERITREAQAMGRLGDHPHIVSIYDFGTEPSPSGRGQGEGAQPYMVFPLLPGGDVEDLIEKAENHQLPLEQAVRITLEVCQALEHAHSRGVLHRDVKPGNVVLTQAGTAQLADFGLAVAIDRSRLTQAGMMVGTVSYMPPEQALGGEITPRSDLYSVGCMLYEMVTGRPPFVGDDQIAIIGQHLNTPPVAPSWHRPDLPKGLEALILRLLEKDPNKRPASAAEVRQALSSIDLRPIDVGAQRAVPSDAPSAENPLYRRTFVGREAELRQLQSAFDAAISGQGSLAMVVGEPGIGKTALVEQLATYVALRGGRTLVGHCYEEGSLSLPYLAFVEAMRSYVLAREPDALKSDLGTGAADVARIVSEIRDRVQVELRPPGDPEDDRWRLLQAVSGFLRNAAGVQPLLIVLEDLHWADRGTLDLLLHIARNLQGGRFLIVGTYRDVEVDRTHPLSSTLAELSRIATFGRVRLRGLTAEEVQRILSSLLTQDVQWALAEAVHRQTEGNPLFVQEVVRYLAEEGLISREEGRWRRTGDQPLSLAIPEGLRDVIGKRLSRLSPECNRLLATAGVIGRDFDLATLRAVAVLDENALVTALEEATKVGVLEERSQPGAILYRFTHAFFRQTLYEELSAPRRLRLHQEVARALEQQYAERRQEHAAELAEHFANSTDRADLQRAVEYGELAAKRAISAFAYGEAVRLLERALDVQEVLDPDDKAKRCDLLLALGEALMPAGEPLRAARQVAEEAFRLADTSANEGKAARAANLALEGLIRYNASFGGMEDEYLMWSDRLIRHAAPGTPLRVNAEMLIAAQSGRSGESAAVRAARERALSLARELGDPDAIFRVLWSTILGQSARIDQTERVALLREFSDISTAGAHTRTQVEFLWHSGDAWLDVGERAMGEALWARLDELAERFRDPFARLSSFRPARLVLDGRLEEALAECNVLVQIGDESGMSVRARAILTRHLTTLYLHLGRAADLLDLFTPTELTYPASLAALALIHCHVGHDQDAKTVLYQWIQRPLGVFNDSFRRGSVYALEAAVVLGDREMSANLVATLSAAANRCDITWSLMSFGRPLGAAAALLGQPDEARTYYQQALEACAKIRHRPEIALTRFQLAELLLDHYPDERAEALDHLDFAINEFRDMKMQPSLERALRHRGLLRA